MDADFDRNIIEKNVDCQRVFDGIILHIDHLTNELPNGHLAKREVARHIGASAVVLLIGFGLWRSLWCRWTPRATCGW